MATSLLRLFHKHAADDMQSPFGIALWTLQNIFGRRCLSLYTSIAKIVQQASRIVGINTPRCGVMVYAVNLQNPNRKVSDEVACAVSLEA